MTAQIGSIFKLNGNRYNIVSKSRHIKFNPQEYGITPLSCCTACWDGYWCEYNITKEGILLENLYINSYDDYYPAINGIEPLYDEENGKFVTHVGHRVYQGINLKCDYTGRIVVGREFLPEYYIHSGYQRGYGYEEVKELVLKNGDLVKVIDHSEEARKIREKMKADAESKNKKYIYLPNFLNGSFDSEDDI